MTKIGTAIASRELELDCLRRLRRGDTYAAIAKDLDLTVGRVSTLVRRAYSRTECAEELEVDIQRKTSIGRINEMIKAVYAQAIGEESRLITLPTGKEIAIKSPDPHAIKLINELERSRRELLGLDVQQKKDSSGQVSVVVSYVNQHIQRPGDELVAPMIDVSYEQVPVICPQEDQEVAQPQLPSPEV